jgi:DNA-directed RNA polymerase subunit RPC12/RpoP
MEHSCLKCGARLESPWSFCPLCGAAAAHEAAEKPVPHEHQNAPLRGAFGGMLFGILAAPVFIIVGGMLCLTWLGAIAGIPMIIAGVISPLAGPILGMGQLKGQCPWCSAPVSCLGLFDGFSCPSCGKRIAVKNHHRELAKAN